jgi:hypothetical protein
MGRGALEKGSKQQQDHQAARQGQGRAGGQRRFGQQEEKKKWAENGKKLELFHRQALMSNSFTCVCLWR